MLQYGYVYICSVGANFMPILPSPQVSFGPHSVFMSEFEVIVANRWLLVTLGNDLSGFKQDQSKFCSHRLQGVKLTKMLTYLLTYSMEQSPS